MSKLISAATVVAFLVLAAGCAQEAASPDATATRAPASADGLPYLLASEPEGARNVIGVREVASNEQAVVITGRIGGSENPWIDGKAAFSIVDLSLQACSDIPGDACPKPWDYCCETDKLPQATALVKFVDADGNLLGHDARRLLNLEELQTVVIRGNAQRDDAGNLAVLASGLYVRTPGATAANP